MSTVANAMAAQGFHSAKARTDCCAWCQHVEVDYPERMPPYDKPTYACGLGKFRVSLMAVCDRHYPGKARAGLA